MPTGADVIRGPYDQALSTEGTKVRIFQLVYDHQPGLQVVEHVYWQERRHAMQLLRLARTGEEDINDSDRDGVNDRREDEIGMFFKNDFSFPGADLPSSKKDHEVDAEVFAEASEKKSLPVALNWAFPTLLSTSWSTDHDPRPGYQWANR